MNLNEVVKSDKYQVICFDIFNTLLVHPLFASGDIYKLLGKKIGYENLYDAVSIAEKRLLSDDETGRAGFSSEMLYREIEKLFPKKFSAEKALAAEEELYLNICTERRYVKKLYDAARRNGKEIAVVTDYPVSRRLLEKILEKNGYTNYRDIYIAHETGAAKKDGTLFGLIAKEFSDVADSASGIFYLTTVYDNDMKSAESVGMSARYIPSPIAALRKCRKLGELYNNLPADSDNRYLIAYSANLVFDDPFVEYSDDGYLNGSIDNFGEFVFSPLVLAFEKWMLDDCERSGVTDLCYVYRDGYLPEKMHNVMAKYYGSVKTCRMYLTRALANVFYSEENNGLNESLNKYLTGINMKRDVFIKNRLFAEEGSEDYSEAVRIFRQHGVFNADDIIRRDEYFKYAQEFEGIFKRGAQNRMDETRAYIDSIFSGRGKTAVFDVGYRGSACGILKNNFNIDTVGYHFFAKEMVKNINVEGLDVRSPIIMGLSDEQKTTVIQVLTEDLLNSQEPSVIGVKREDSEFVLLRDEHINFSEAVDAIQTSCVEYARGVVSLLGEDFKLMRFDVLAFYEFYRRFLERMSEKDCGLFSGIRFVDSTFMNPEARNAYLDLRNRVYQANSGEELQDQPNEADVGEENNYSAFRINTYNWLKEHHILTPFRAVWRFGRRVKNFIVAPADSRGNKFPEAAQVISDFENSIKTIRNNMFYRTAPTVIFCGHNAAFDKGTCDYINKAVGTDSGNHYLFISEAPHVKQEQLNSKIKFDSKVLHYVPMSGDYHIGIDMPSSAELNAFIGSKKYLAEAVESIKARFPDMGKNYPRYLAKYLFDYYSALINAYGTENAGVVFVVWNEFTTMHSILHGICRERNIPILFMEFGVIPGTLCLESTGQMGESLVANKSEEFCELPVSEEELADADKLLTFLKESGLNRNPQPLNSQLDDIRARLVPERPTVLYFGQNDFESGMYPYGKNAKKYHSPIFKTSNEAAKILEKICRRKGWNYIYKPHPTIMAMYGCDAGLSDSTIIADNVDINALIDLSTVTVTILSQAAYISLVRGKPAVMLGRNQLIGKGCAYECLVGPNIEPTLSKAVKEGYTETMKAAFIRHTAQLNKYYLYYDLRSNGGVWGQDITKFSELIKNTAAAVDKRTENKPSAVMKIAVIASMPANYYSGGRSHAWNVAESLAYMGNEVYFISQNEPVFKNAMKNNGSEKKISFVKTNDFIVDIPNVRSLDYVIIAPHRDKNELFYLKARNFAVKMNARLVLINYESGNWVNKYLDNELPDELWTPWKNVCKDGCLVLSSDLESMKYAKEYYLTNPRNTVFDYWYPTVNTVAADSVPDCEKEKRIVALIRLNDKYKGSYDILKMVDKRWAGYKLVLIYGSGIMDDNFKKYAAELDRLRKECGVDYEIKIQPTDAEKFAEIKRAKYLLFPSYFEGYGTPPIEAQYCNTVCFAYDLPVLRETAGSGIVFCEYGNPDDMKNKIIEHIENNITYSGMRESVEEYARFDRCAPKLDRLLREHLAEDWRDPMARTTDIK